MHQPFLLYIENPRQSPRFSIYNKKRNSKTVPLEAPPRFELGIRVLQTHALPLGYSAEKMERNTRLELATSTLARWRSTR